MWWVSTRSHGSEGPSLIIHIQPARPSLIRFHTPTRQNNKNFSSVEGYGCRNPPNSFRFIILRFNFSPDEGKIVQIYFGNEKKLIFCQLANKLVGDQRGPFECCEHCVCCQNRLLHTAQKDLKCGNDDQR